jgi:signal transduction histidine kinase
MPSGGRLEITAGTSGREAWVRVCDTGTGMSPEMRARAFQPLTGEFTQGTGLGLAIVYRIVQDHGGRVGLDSAPGAGTRIEVRLPSAERGVIAGGTR